MSKLTSQIEIYEYNKILAIFVLNNNSTSMKIIFRNKNSRYMFSL